MEPKRNTKFEGYPIVKQRSVLVELVLAYIAGLLSEVTFNNIGWISAHLATLIVAAKELLESWFRGGPPHA